MRWRTGLSSIGLSSVKMQAIHSSNVAAAQEWRAAALCRTVVASRWLGLYRAPAEIR